MSNRDQFLAYLRHYADKDIDQIAAMFADTITLRDWKLSVSGKAAALSETARNFAADGRILAIRAYPGRGDA